MSGPETGEVASTKFDEGMGVVELVIAMLVFSIVAAGIASSTITVNRLTQDSRSREVATNLAAKDLDAARAYGDPDDIPSGAQPDYTDSNGRTYRITRTVVPVSVTGTDTSCGSSDIGRFSRINVSVDWDGRLATTQKVVSNTILAPPVAAKDVTVGSISIRVTDANGKGQSGVDVSVTPIANGGGRALAKQPDDTDANGCSHADRVVPGTYTITLSHDGWVSTDQQETPTKQSVSVAANSTYAWPVTYDSWATFNLKYAKNFTAGTPLLPRELTTTIDPVASSYPLAVKSTPADTSLHLAPGGYTAVAGTSATSRSGDNACSAVDPRNWPAGKVGSTSMAAGQAATASASAGGTADFTTGGTTPATVPMGVVRVTGLPYSYITAQSIDSKANGNPGCATSTTYTFDRLGATGAAYLALPYGSWQLYSSTSVGVLSLASPITSLQILTNRNGITTSGLLGLFSSAVTLDPRAVAP